MAEADAIEAYDSLVDWLKTNKLEWLAEQIEEETALGKTESKRLNIVESGLQEFALQPTTREIQKRQSAEFLVRIDYSPYEKFDIALSAIRAVVVGSVKIQESLARALDIGAREISFVPGETGTIEHQYRLSDLDIQMVAIHEVERLLSQLAEDVRK